MHYADGTPLWGQKALFQPGTHDWQQAECLFEVAKPVASMEVFVLFRKAKGTVWFDDLEVSLTPFELRGQQVLPGLYGGRSLAVAGGATLPGRWLVQVLGPRGVLAEQRGSQLPYRFDWLGQADTPREVIVRTAVTDDLQGETVRDERRVTLGAGEPDRGYAAWVADSMVRVAPAHLPPGNASREVRLSLARNEAESFQVLLLPAPGRPLRDVTVELEDLVCPDRQNRLVGRLERRNLTWHQVGYVKIDRLRGHPGDPDALPGWWPDALLPVTRCQVEPSFTQALWVTVNAPRDTIPGRYVGSLTVRPANAPPTRVDLAVQVHPVELPVTGHLKTAFALMDGFLEKLYGRPLPAGLKRQYGDFVLDYRLNPDDISRTEPPDLEDLKHYRARGMNAFNIVNMVEERGARTWVCWSPLNVYTPAFKQRLIERIDPVVAALRREGLLDLAYIYTFDERSEEFFPTIREYFGLVKERWPEVKTFTTAYVKLEPELGRDLNIDWHCPLTARYDLAAAERCRAAGQQVWAYVCMGPGYPYANILADSPLIEGRVLSWQAFDQQIDGLLYWGLNIWSRAGNDHLIDPAQGPLLDWSITTGGQHDWLHGDGELLYAGKDGPIGSIRLANLRDGLEDYELLHLLAQRTGSLAEARAACRPVTRALTDFTRDPAVLREAREALCRRLAP